MIHHYNQAAATIAYALSQGRPLPEEALAVFDEPESKLEAKQALTQYGVTRILRKLPSGKPFQTAPLEGSCCPLYKAPMPSEHQAKLSYEYLLAEFETFLKRRIFAVTVNQSEAHLAIWVPGEQISPDIAALWQEFIEYMTTPESFSRGFRLVMNASKLSDRGFSVLEIPIISQYHPKAIAAFYLANLQTVEKRINKRRRDIQEAQWELDALPAEADDERRRKLNKQIKDNQDKDVKEEGKYVSSFEKVKGNLDDQARAYHELDSIDRKLEDADDKTRKELIKQRSKCEKDKNIVFSKGVVRALEEVYAQNPFEYMKRIEQHAELKTAWLAAKQGAKHYNSTATQQLNTSRGDIYAKIMWEMFVLLFGNRQITLLQPLVNFTPFAQGVREAGDNRGKTCYSCGNQMTEDTSYDSRRLLFESPDQRAQSGGSSSDVKVCHTCAALSVLSPVKFAPDTLVIRLNPSKTSVTDHVRQSLEQQVLNEIGAVAGRYINLTCTEKEKQQEKYVFATQRLGRRQYAVAKLASLYAPHVLRYISPVLYTSGQEVGLSTSVLVGTCVLSSMYNQRIQVKEKDVTKINLKLGEAVRLLEKGEFVKASYILSRASEGTPKLYALESSTQMYHEVLVEEELMSQHVEKLQDVHAMIGLMMPFCCQIIARASKIGLKTEADEWREVGKLIQSVDENPSVFSYSTGKTVGGVGHLKRDNGTHFVFDQAQALMEKLGDIPVYIDKEGRTRGEGEHEIRVTSEVIAKAYEHILSKECYQSDYELKDFFYQVRLGLYARFPQAMGSREGKK